MSGLFISFDGVDGGGKSTQIQLLRTWLSQQGHSPVICRDPGSTPLGERVRDILLSQADLEIGGRTELLLYMASRAQLVEQVIQPALEQGRIVISDRFLLANVVYQGHAGDVDPALVWEVGAVATAGLMPDLTIVLDMPVEDALQRIDRAHDRMESRGIDYLNRVRQGFLDEVSSSLDRALLVDASQSVPEVQSEIQRAVHKALVDAEGPGAS